MAKKGIPKKDGSGKGNKGRGGCGPQKGKGKKINFPKNRRQIS